MTTQTQKNRFSAVKEIPREQIVTRVGDFQGRDKEFSEESVRKIVREGFDKSQEPIIVWYDKLERVYVVISGHSRFEASRRLYEAGDKSLRMMPVKEFNGTFEQAVEYALLESNRSGTAEGLISDVKAYKKAVATGCNKDCLQGYFKTESYINVLQRLSKLNENGEFLKTLNNPNEAKVFPRLQQYAEWTGELRKFYARLTDSHENEIFRYLYLDGNLSKVNTKDEFSKLIGKAVSNFTFDPSKPLNLKNFVGKSIYQANSENEIAILENKIEEGKEEIAKRQRAIAKTSNQERASELQREISGINASIIKKYDQINKLKASVKQAERQDVDMFSFVPQTNPQEDKTKQLLRDLKSINIQGMKGLGAVANFIIKIYSDKSYAVFFDQRVSKEVNEELKFNGGLFNARLQNGGDLQAGYIFKKSDWTDWQELKGVVEGILRKYENSPSKPAPSPKSEPVPEPEPEPDPTPTGNWENDLQRLLRSLQVGNSGVDEEAVKKIVKSEVKKLNVPTTTVVKYDLPFAEGSPQSDSTIPNFQKIIDDIVLGNNVYMVGGAGTGKTYLAQKIAEALGRNVETINCSQWTAPTEIIGGQTLDGYQEGKMIEAFRRGSMLLLDEMPKLEPNTAGLFNEALAKTGDKLKWIGDDRKPNFDEIKKTLVKVLDTNVVEKIIKDAESEKDSVELSYLKIEKAMLETFGASRVKDLEPAQQVKLFNQCDITFLKIMKYPTIQNSRKERFVKHPYFCVVGTGNIYPNSTNAAYGANNKQDLSLLDRFAGSVYVISKNPDLEKKLLGYVWLWSIWNTLRDLIEREKWEAQVSIRVMQSSLRIYSQEMDRVRKGETELIEKGKTLKDVIDSFITSGFSEEQTNKMKTAINYNTEIARNQYRHK